MIRLLIAGPGTGKSHWLQNQRAAITVPCTNKSHRGVLCAIADDMGITYQSRASIDDLVALVLGQAPTTIALDDVDRTSPKLCYTILSMASRHTVLATATDRKRIKPLLDRQAAIIVPLSPAPIADIIAGRYPDLSPAQVRRIQQIASTPAAASRIPPTFTSPRDSCKNSQPSSAMNTGVLATIQAVVVA